MAAKDFSAKLAATLKASTPGAYAEAIATIQEVAQGIQDILPKAAAKKKGAVVQLEPGFPSQLGQQINVVLKIAENNVSDTLFRIYVTPDGRFNLDLYGEQPIVCADKEALEAQILAFLARPEVVARLNLYRDLIKN
jgi:hypothetical protein